MTKKHFEALADALAEERPDGPNTGTHPKEVWDHCVRAVAHVCMDTNERFDLARFIEACETRDKDA